MFTTAPGGAKNNVKTNLSNMQQKFVAAYHGNATEAAKTAGYANPDIAGHRLLRNVKIAKELRKREEKELKPAIKSRLQRQKFWSDMMENAKKESDRLKASELLARSEGDFLDRVEMTGNIDVFHDLVNRVCSRFVPFADREYIEGRQDEPILIEHEETETAQ